MKILFVSDNFPPEVNAPATRTYEHCLEWVKKGASVTVLTCFPNFPHGQIYPGYRQRLIKKEMMDGIEVIRVWTYMAPNRGVFRRTLDYVSFCVASLFAGLFRKTDLIIATSPQFFSAVSGYLLGLMKRKPWVFELRDLWPDSIHTVGAVKRSLGLQMVEKLELFLYNRATAIVPNTHAFKRDLVERGIDPDKIKVVTNGSNLDHYHPQPKNPDVMRRLGINGKFVVGYIGTIGLAHRLDFIISAIPKIDDPSIFFLFIGDGASKEQVTALSKKLNLKNVMFLDPVPKDEVPDYLSIVDAALIPLRKSETFKKVIPSKIFESAAMQKPILLGVDGEAKHLVAEYEAGMFFEPEDEKDFIAKLRNLKENRELYEQLQRGCGRLARDFDRKRLAEEMLDILQEAAGTESAQEVRAVG
jgi:glycosyltransferase involved in cell wall biosynthesis